MQVFEYLLALKNRTVPIVKNFLEYKDIYWWQQELPTGGGCLLTPKTKNPAAWLEVYKQVLTPFPKVPEILLEWVILEGDELDSPPEVHKQLPGLTVQESITFEADRNRVLVWERWLQEEWKPWLLTNQGKIPTQKIYRQLFALYQRLEREGDGTELVWGHGLLAWNSNEAQICRPLFTTRMELIFDHQKEVFYFLPANSGTSLELDMLSNDERINPDQKNSLENFIQDVGMDPWEEDVAKIFFKELIEMLSPAGKVHNEIISGRNVFLGTNPIIYHAPLLFVRSMTGRQWHTELQDIIDEIKRGYEVPQSIKALASMDISNQDEEDKLEWNKLGEEVLFPLPANEEQREIVNKLSKNIGVVVQGPPGTGKSHTIVNLIAHLLAHGKRVLITSQTHRALHVLGEMIRDKLPEIAPLCVSVMGGDARSVQELEVAVTKISEGLDQVNVDRTTIEIERLRQELVECKEKIKKYKSKLSCAIEAENSSISFAEEEFTPLELANWLATHQSEYGWIPDELDEATKLPLSDAQLVSLYGLLEEITKEESDQILQHRPSLENLPSTEEMKSLFLRLEELGAENEIRKEHTKGWVFSKKANRKAPEALEIIEKAGATLGLFQEEWLIKTLEDIVYRENQVSYWQRFMIDCKAKIRAIREVEHRMAEIAFTIPEALDLRQVKMDAEVLKSELANHQTPSFMFKNFTGKKTLYLLETLTVNGSNLRTPEDLGNLLQYLALVEARTRLVLKWNHSISAVNGPLLEEADKSILQTIEKNIEVIQQVFDWRSEHLPLLLEVIQESNPLGKHEWVNPTWLANLAQGIIYHVQLLEYNLLYQEFETFSLYLKKGLAEENPHPAWGRLYDAYRIGDDATWQHVLLELRKLHSNESKIHEMLDLRNRLYACAPRFTVQIESMVRAKECNQPPATWRYAWEWKRADCWLKKQSARIRLDYNYEQLHRARQEEARLIQTIVSKSTWLEQNLRTTEIQRRSLRSWIQTIRRIGKGTGKYVAKHQADAKKEMAICRSAVPVWIMPINRVIENFRPTQQPFDVVIVDESSQSNLFALSALFRGKRAIIVGDDRQISPEAVGTDQEEINDLIEHYLCHIPQRERFTLQDSLYDTALRVFPGQQIMLSEHFRCVPEIIGFSNQEFYGGSIEPLRVPASDRLMPPIALVRVNGYRKEGVAAINQGEAQAIVHKIVELCSKEEYRHKTMGVISLQGKDQAYVIEQLLQEELGEKEIINRKIICGDAYSFQGDERDVMFISMVAAPNTRNGILNKSTDEQRFNVATSRAKEQMWVFHSLGLEDLQESCMRYRLLTYCQEFGLSQEKNETAMQIFRKYGSSQFLQDVYKEISLRGYKAIPECKVGTHDYRIPIIIEGATTRLAVVCDGDAWQGIERWEEKLERQHVLERVGWNFWKIRGSHFYRNREKALEPLWTTLTAMGIEVQKNP